MAVTSFDAILGMAPTQPEELTLSGWSPDTEITVLVKKPNFYNLLAKNAIPNPLLPEMQKLFVRRQVAEEHSKASADFAKAHTHCQGVPGRAGLHAARRSGRGAY